MSKDNDLRRSQCFRCSNIRIAKPFPDESFTYCAAFGESVDVFQGDLLRVPQFSPAIANVMHGAHCIRFVVRAPLFNEDSLYDHAGATLLLSRLQPNK